ncbi:MAG TPA: ABC transporter substrate-binding protein, partial [Stellaceae bacterium]|nr:ABC transporter substrate-binding protein [Stellaceae bacterium]
MKIRLSLLMLGLVAAMPAFADDHVTIGTDWRAEAPHAGIYQALATGLYKKHHLDVTIVQGGPNLNQGQLLAAGRYDFSVQSNSFEPL